MSIQAPYSLYLQNDAHTHLTAKEGLSRDTTGLHGFHAEHEGGCRRWHVAVQAAAMPHVGCHLTGHHTGAGSDKCS